MVKAVLFDFDDTLVRTIDTKVQALQETSRRFYHFDLDSEFIREHWGKAYNELLRVLFLEAKDDLENIVRNYEFIANSHPATLHDDALYTLQVLFEAIPVGIVTSASRRVLLRDIRLLQLPEEKFFYIQTADDTSVHKPNPRVFEPILKKLADMGIERSETIYVGDALNDYLAAKGAGLKFYALADRTTSKAEFRKHGVTVLGSLEELLSFL